MSVGLTINVTVYFTMLDEMGGCGILAEGARSTDGWANAGGTCRHGRASGGPFSGQREASMDDWCGE